MSSYDKDYVCEDYGDVKQWTQIRVRVKVDQLELLTAIMSMVNNNLMIEDYSDIETGLNTCYGDLIDEKILNQDRTVAYVSVFVPSDRSYTDDYAFITSQLWASGIDAQTEIVGVNEEDWANSWKQYYKPIVIGERIVICPAWEEYTPTENQLVVRMNPGMAFGTGSHETTRLVIRLLEKYIKPGDRMLDVGTGTGILAICASRLGAAACRAYDIDPMAVRVARENVAESGLDNIECGQSDLLKSVDLSQGPYDIMTANIVADIIIRMLEQSNPEDYLKKDGIAVFSGIIESRSHDVVEALESHGFSVVEILTDNDWCGIVARGK